MSSGNEKSTCGSNSAESEDRRVGDMTDRSRKQGVPDKQRAGRIRLAAHGKADAARTVTGRVVDPRPCPNRHSPLPS